MKVEISNEEKVFFPDVGITKGDLIAFYDDISHHILPYLQDRPLMMHRFPDGIDSDGFYQKEAGNYFPAAIETKNIKKEGGRVNHVICQNKSTLKYLVNQGTIAFHTWLSRKDALHHPDKLIIDLDPPGDDFEIVRDAALTLHEFFKNAGVTTFAMTTGSRGIHVMVPMNGKSQFDDVRDVATHLGGIMVEKHGDIFTQEVRKNKRKGRLYFDIQRNAYGQTSVCPYSVRAIEGAPVATPLDWDEMSDGSICAQSFTVKNLEKRLAQKEDPWKNHRKHAIGLKRLKKLLQ
ncbi:MAG: non-homologous end-joining DNA ligase [Flavobacteriales bacterium]|nr:non-homologous end-joining DNA ligase [Flavobacteriales bacterium]